MKTKAFIFLTSLFIFSGIVYNVNAQEQNTSTNPVYEYWKHEKLIYPLEKLPSIIEQYQNEKHQSINQNNKSGNKILGQSEVVVSGDVAPQSELHAAINPTDTNNIVISPMRQDRYNMLQALLCPIYYTKDFGKTWNKSTFNSLPQDPNAFVIGGGDPVLAFDKNGKLYFSWINLYVGLQGQTIDSIHASIFWAYSTNKGVDWNRESNDAIKSLKRKYSQFGAGIPGIYDKQWMAVDRSNSIYQGNLYASMTFVGTGITPFSSLFLSRKETNNNTFSVDTTLISKGNYSFVQFSSIDVDNNGKVHVTFFGSKNNQSALYYSNSSDGGTTFSPEQKISDFILSGAGMIPGSDMLDSISGILTSRLYPCPQLTVDKSNSATSGNLYLAWTANGIDQKLNNGSDIYFTRSSDDGVSWSNPVIINDNPSGIKNEQYYPAITVNENGVLIISWYDRRTDVQNNLNTHIFMVYSFDGGKSFTKNFNVTTIPTDFSTVGEQNGGFGIGEYTEVLSTKGYAIPVWTDGRTNDGDLSIYAAFMPITENPEITSVEKIINVNNGLELSDPQPNPVNNSFEITYKIPLGTNFDITITDISGNVVKKILNSNCEPGEYDLNVNTSDIANGIYLCRLSTAYGYSLKKIIILR